MSIHAETQCKPATISQPIHLVSEFLVFVQDAQAMLKNNLASANDVGVKQIRNAVEDHYVDDHGKPAMYQKIESAFYDNARELVTLWRFFGQYKHDQLRWFQRMVKLEHEGLTGDRHPRRVFDRSPFGIIALVLGTITIWMTVLQKYAGEKLDWIEPIQFNWFVGGMWIVGLFVVLWFILKTVRNNRQVASLASIGRALELYREDGFTL